MNTSTTSQKLAKIAEKFSAINYNENNYEIGGGLSFGKFASVRHEDAKNDEGKVTLGEATAMFKKATGLDSDTLKAIFTYAVPNMEWHHAGKLPKAYGGGMKKTYFLNAQEITDIATNFERYHNRVELSVATKKQEEEEKKSLEERRLEFLEANAERVVRLSSRPSFFFLIKREMEGKYGWFDSSNKSYNLPEYFTGWKFHSEEAYNNYFKIK